MVYYLPGKIQEECVTPYAFQVKMCKIGLSEIPSVERNDINLIPLVS